MARRRYLNTVIKCSRFDPSIKVATPNRVMAPVGLNCWIASKGKTLPCKDPDTGRKTTCFPYLHLEHDISYPARTPRYRGKGNG